MLDASAIVALPAQLALGTAPAMTGEAGHMAAIPIDSADLGAVDALVTAAVASQVAQAAADLLTKLVCMLSEVQVGRHWGMAGAKGVGGAGLAGGQLHGAEGELS